MRFLIIVFGLLLFFKVSYADISNFELVNSQNPYADIFNQVGQQYGINPVLLYSIAYHESSMNPKAINKNTNGSYDYGLMQVNSSNLSSLGLNTTTVFDPTKNIEGGAHVLAGCFRQFGNSKLAIDCYNKGYNRSILSDVSMYVQQVMVIFDSLTKTGLLADVAKIVKNGVNSTESFFQRIENLFGMPLVVLIVFVLSLLAIAVLIVILPILGSLIMTVSGFAFTLYKILKVSKFIKDKITK